MQISCAFHVTNLRYSCNIKLPLTQSFVIWSMSLCAQKDVCDIWWMCEQIPSHISICPFPLWIMVPPVIWTLCVQLASFTVSSEKIRWPRGEPWGTSSSVYFEIVPLLYCSQSGNHHCRRRKDAWGLCVSHLSIPFFYCNIYLGPNLHLVLTFSKSQ